MIIKRRDFLKTTGIATAGSTLYAGYPWKKSQDQFDSLNEKGIHPVLEKDHP